LREVRHRPEEKTSLAGDMIDEQKGNRDLKKRIKTEGGTHIG